MAAPGGTPAYGSQHAQFYMGAVQDEAASKEQGRPIFKDVPFCRIFTPGDKDNVVDQPVWAEDQHPYSPQKRFPEQWKAFKESGKDEVSGTPLSLMPGITKAFVEEMAFFHVRTIEQLADLTDGNAQRFRGIQVQRDEARAYIERAKGAAPEKMMRSELDKMREENELLKKQMAELAKAQAQQHSRNEKR